MLKSSSVRRLFSVLAVGVMSLGGMSAVQAATCTAFTNPDVTNPEATLTNSTLCGPGIANDVNDEAADIGTVVGGTWTNLGRDNAGGSNDSGIATTGVLNGGTAGSWAFDALSPYNKYVIVIKDGGVPGGNAPTSYMWFWFVVDLAAGCDSTSALANSGLDYCGLWTMYGENGSPKQISHLTLYGATVASGTTPGTATPEPGSVSLALLGLGLVGGALVTRRRKIAG